MGYILDTWDWEDGSAGKRFFFFSFFLGKHDGLGCSCCDPSAAEEGQRQEAPGTVTDCL